jgi:hypothetical protein
MQATVERGQQAQKRIDRLNRKTHA